MKMKTKSNSLTAILALTSATADSFAHASIDDAETAAVESEAGAAAAVAVVPPPQTSHDPATIRQRQRTRRANANSNGRRQLRRNDEFLNRNITQNDDKEEAGQQTSASRRRLRQHARQTAQSSSSASTSSAPGCGPSPGTHHSAYLGCYSDRANDRAFPFELYENMSRNRRLGHGALDCERECSQRGYRYFGREFKGQCFCGNELGKIGRHGNTGGCDCCGGNVGPGIMCVWENANHPDSQAQPPEIPVILPQYSQPVSNQLSNAIQPMHSHIDTSSIKSDSINHNQNQISTKPKNNSNNNNSGFTSKPIGGFRIRLDWQRGYNWQENPREQFYCMECRGTCKSGSSIQIDKCDSSVRQKFIAVSRTIRPASNPSLCLTIAGYGGKRNPVRLRHCNRGSNQNFVEVRANERFELQTEDNLGRCLSQHHHPRPHESVFPETCEKTRRFDTTYWKSY